MLKYLAQHSNFERGCGDAEVRGSYCAIKTEISCYWLYNWEHLKLWNAI